MKTSKFISIITENTCRYKASIHIYNYIREKPEIQQKLSKENLWIWIQIWVLSFTNFISWVSFYFSTMMPINPMECFFFSFTYNIDSEKYVQFLM